MPTRNSTRRLPPQLIPILGRLSDGMAIVDVVQRCLHGNEVAAVEASALKTGLAMLWAVYTELGDAGEPP